MKYFIFAIVFLCSATNLRAQDFFVPDGAFSSTTEKLKPLEVKSPTYTQGHYKVIEGRVYAIKDEQQELPTETLSEEPLPQEQASSLPILQDAPIVSPSEPVVEQPSPAFIVEDEPKVIKPTIPAPAVEPLNDKLPSYKNRYALYVADLQKFQETGKMPENQDLKATLEKLSAPREIVLFQGQLN